MLLKELGASGIQVPEVGLGTGTGTWRKPLNPAAIQTAVDNGVTFIDTAEAYYDAERTLAAVLSRYPRSQLFLATKVSPDRLRYHQVVRAAQGSLRRLRTDYLDLYQVHWPNSTVPWEETMAALEDLIDGGLVRFIGLCNVSIDQILAAQAALRKHPLSTVQVWYSLLYRPVEFGLLPWCRERKITIVAYRPTGHRYAHDRRRLKQSPALTAAVQETGKSRAQIMLNWCLKDGVIAIPFSSNPDHVKDNVASSGWELPAEHRQALEAEFPLNV